jgi:hypothetical protein
MSSTNKPLISIDDKQNVEFHWISSKKTSFKEDDYGLHTYKNSL